MRTVELIQSDRSGRRLHRPARREAVPPPARFAMILTPGHRAGPSSAPVELLSLQRMAGNRAVQRLVGTNATTGCCHACARGGTCTNEPVQRDERELPVDTATDHVASEEPPAPMPTEPELDTSELDALAGSASTAVEVVQRQAGGGAAPGAGAVCNVFADMIGFPRRNRGRRAFAARTGMRFALRNGRFQAVWNRATSWVNTSQVPIGGGRTARVAALVAQCRRAFRRRNTASFDVNPAGDCPAVAAAAHQATNRAECETVIGARLDAEEQTDIARLTTHEQYHLKLACELARLANAALSAGTPLRRVSRQLSAASRREQRRYDADTDHGCDAGAQAGWQADIDGGNLVFP